MVGCLWSPLITQGKDISKTVYLPPLFSLHFVARKTIPPHTFHLLATLYEACVYHSDMQPSKAPPSSHVQPEKKCIHRRVTLPLHWSLESSQLSYLSSTALKLCLSCSPANRNECIFAFVRIRHLPRTE